MTTNKKTAIALGLLLSISCGAFAKDTGYYIGVNGGIAKTGMDKALIADENKQLSDAGVTGSVTYKDITAGTTIFAGARISKYVALELGYTNPGTSSIKTEAMLGGSMLVSEMKRPVSLVYFDGMSMLPLNSKATVFGRLGVAYTKVTMDVTTTWAGLTVKDSVSTTELTPKIGIGFDYNLTENLALRTQYERYLNVGKRDKTGDTDIEFLNIGLKFTF